MLEWMGKKKVVNHHNDVPFHVLERKYSFDASGKHEKDNGSGNMIIHGDNLVALKSLLPDRGRRHMPFSTRMRGMAGRGGRRIQGRGCRVEEVLGGSRRARDGGGRRQDLGKDCPVRQGELPSI